MSMSWSVRLGEACVLGETVRPEDFVAELDDIDLHSLVADVFDNDRGDDNLPFVQRLAALAGPRFNVLHAFSIACSSGALAVAQWIHAQSPETCRPYLPRALEHACTYRRMPVVQWLLTLDGSKDIDMSRAFQIACRAHNMPLARYLVSLGKVDIHGDRDYALNTLASCRAWESCRWLLGLDPACTTWPVDTLHRIRMWSWSAARDAWMRSVCRCLPPQYTCSLSGPPMERQLSSCQRAELVT